MTKEEQIILMMAGMMSGERIKARERYQKSHKINPDEITVQEFKHYCGCTNWLTGSGVEVTNG